MERPGMEKDSSLWFKINEEKGGEVLYFRRRHGKLWKLGDGTFGVVYVVHSDLRGNDFAVKLLYDNESTTPRPLSRLPREAVSAVAQRVLEENDWSEEAASELLEIVLANYQSPDALVLAASRAELPGWESILDQNPKARQLDRGGAVQPRVPGVRHHPRGSTEPVEPRSGQRNGRHHRQHTAIPVIPGL